jgi:hypothetical protein
VVYVEQENCRIRLGLGLEAPGGSIESTDLDNISYKQKVFKGQLTKGNF